MPRGPRTTKGGKRRSKLRLLVLVTAPLLLCCALFIAMDNLILYWFVLFNNDDDAEARRREDYHWYDNYGQQNPDGSGNTASPGYTNKHQSGGGLEYALNTVAASLTIEEMKTKETAMRFFIYLMDNKGYVPNAIVGAMSYMMQEGTALGTFTYESYKYCTGPSGKYYDDTLDNEAWLKWLDGSGFNQAVQLYANMRANGKSVGYAAIGLGLTQESDVWKWDGSKGTHRATDLINFAISKGGPWQYPNIQMMYYEQKFQGDVAWDIDQSPGVDPKSSTEVTAAEWAGRVLCGIGMPGWSYTLALDPAYPTSHESLQHHVQYVPNAQAMYDQYSGKDPWFYNADGSLKYGGFAEGMCPACGRSDTNDWHCPFCGPVYDNSTTQGLLLARVALLLAGTNRANGQSKILYDGWGYETAAIKRSELTYYRRAHRVTCNDQYTASCDRGVATAVRLSGIDPDFEKAIVSNIQEYMENSPRWECLGDASTVSPQPGDVIAYHYGSRGHIQIWMGQNVAGERWPSTTAQMYQASYMEHHPDVANETPKGETNATYPYKVYRCVDPVYDSSYWIKFVTEDSVDFSDFKQPSGVPVTYAGGNVFEPGVNTGNNTGTGSSNNNGPAEADDDWFWPCGSITKLTSRMGPRTYYMNGKPQSDTHNANDIATPSGTPIYAANNGTVRTGSTTSSPFDWSYGNIVEINHGNGYITMYAHLSSFVVSDGDVVSKGDLIGYSGSTGNSTGPHLHFQVKYMGTNMDCLKLYPGMTFTGPNGNAIAGG